MPGELMDAYGLATIPSPPSNLRINSLSPPARVLFVLLRQRLSVIIRDNSLTRTTTSIQAIAAVASVHHVSLRRGNPYSPQHLTMATTQEDCRVGAQDLQNPPTTGPSLHRGLFQMF